VNVAKLPELLSRRYNCEFEVGRRERREEDLMKDHLRDHPWMARLIPVFEGLSPVSINAIGQVLAEYEKDHPNFRVSGDEAQRLAEKCVEAMEEACAEAMYEAVQTHDDS
jgi:hypothetical protein